MKHYIWDSPYLREWELQNLADEFEKESVIAFNDRIDRQRVQALRKIKAKEESYRKVLQDRLEQKKEKSK